MNSKVVLFGISLLVVLVQPATVSFSIPASNAVSRFRRSEASTETPEDNKVCSEILACQWGVYGNDARKRISFFIDNKNCICGNGRKCTKAEDNLSMGAFVYRCMPENPTTTPESTD